MTPDQSLLENYSLYINSDWNHMASGVVKKVCVRLWKRDPAEKSDKWESKRECMGGEREGLYTGLVAWLAVTFSPTIHLYCSQSYLGVLADDK